MSKTQFEFSSDMMLTSLLANRRFGKRQLQLDYQHLFRRLVMGAGVTHSIEIGAFNAYFSRWIKAKIPAVQATAFEANPYVVDHFGPSALSAGVEYRHACVAEHTGEVTLSIPRDYRGTARGRINQIASLLSNKSTEEVDAITVPSIRLDEDVALTATDRVVMWLDVEGALGRVLPHTSQVLERTVLMNVEVEKREIWDQQWLDVDVASFLEDRGFVFLGRDGQSAQQYNCIFANEALFDFGAFKPLLRSFHSASFPRIEQMLQAESTSTGGEA